MTRSRALDAFRGAAIAGMLLVNFAAPLPGAPRLLRHAPWHGFTAADLVFPAFLLIVGVAMYLGFRTPPSAARIVRRSLLLFAIGVAINAFPFVGVDYSKVTIMGVLERIALCYGIGSVLCLALSPRALAGVCIAILVGYAVLLAYGGGYAIETALPGRIDRAVFGPGHLNPDYAPPFDPEGLLGTLPALVNVLAGYLAARWLGSPRRLALAGAVLVAIALVASLAVPINKPLWTPSFAVLTIGLSLELLAIAIAVGDARVLAPLVAMGRRPLTIYVVATLAKGALVWGGALAAMHAALATVTGDTLAAIALALGAVAVFGALGWVVGWIRPRAT